MSVSEGERTLGATGREYERECDRGRARRVDVRADDREHMEKETRTLTDKSPGKQEHAAELGRS